MEKLNVTYLHNLRITILDNAKALQNEADILYSHGMYSRSYLLAYYCVEELGKIPIIVSIINNRENNISINWKKIKKSLNDHTGKIGSQNGHFYAFSQEKDFNGVDSIEWLLNANENILSTYNKKNKSTYVDVINGEILSPLNEINKNDAEEILTLASNCITAHERSENLTNPIIYENNISS